MLIANFQSKKKLMVKVHFNRIEMQRGGKNVWTVHSSEGCFQMEKVEIHTHLTALYNPQGIQPRAYFKGRSRVAVAQHVAHLW